MKKTGVWLDKNKALIIHLEKENESLRKINSDIEHFRPHGGSGTRFKGGPQDVIQDSKFLEREKHQHKYYFEKIILEIKNSDDLVIFGPAETAEKFTKELTKNHKTLSGKVQGVKKTDSMSDNQAIAWVRSFFEL